VLLELFSFVANKNYVCVRSKFCRSAKSQRYRVRGLKGYLGPWERKTEAEGERGRRSLCCLFLHASCTCILHAKPLCSCMLTLPQQMRILVFWYGALLMFLIATENGRYVRRFVLSKCFPTCRINDRRIEGVVQREIEHRERIRAAAMRAAMLADGPAQYLLRTRGMRNVFSNEDGGPANGDQAMQRWIAQAESLGISHTMRPTEFVLQTRKFNSNFDAMKYRAIHFLRFFCQCTPR
jgi:hypothetical protein